MIREKTARKIAGEWHGGQWSGLYKVASGNHAILSRDDWRAALDEACEALDEVSNRKDRAALVSLIKWLVG